MVTLPNGLHLISTKSLQVLLSLLSDLKPMFRFLYVDKVFQALHQNKSDGLEIRISSTLCGPKLVSFLRFAFALECGLNRGLE